MSEFLKRLHHEFMRSKRYDRPLTLMVISVQRSKDILEDQREEINLFLSNLCEATLRETDILNVHDHEVPIKVLLLGTLKEQAQNVKTRIEEKLKKYHYRPYGDQKPLALDFGLAGFSKDMDTFNDLLAAAQSDLVSH